jgi:hypothetical protein
MIAHSKGKWCFEVIRVDSPVTLKLDMLKSAFPVRSVPKAIRPEPVRRVRSCVRWKPAYGDVSPGAEDRPLMKTFPNKAGKALNKNNTYVTVIWKMLPLVV